MKKKTTLAIFSISLITLVVLLAQTNPTSLSSTVLLVPFALLFLVLWTGSLAAMRFLSVAPKKAGKLSLIVAAVPSGLLLLQSIGQLGSWDVATVAALAGITYFYVSKLTSTKQQ